MNEGLMHYRTITSMRDELSKIAIPRWALEMQKAQLGSDYAGSDQIGQAAQQLGLKSRKVRELGGGSEQFAHVRAGGDFSNMPVQPDAGVHTAVYKEMMPDSPIAQGQYQQQLLADRDRVSQMAQQMGGDVQAGIAKSYGHAPSPSGVGYVSAAEHVPGVGLKRLPAEQQAAHLDQLRAHVVGPLKGQGVELHDVLHGGMGPSPGSGAQYGTMYNAPDSSGFSTPRANRGNIIVTPEGKAKIIDHIPEFRGRSAPDEYYRDTPHAQVEYSRYQTPNQLRRDLYNPPPIPKPEFSTRAPTPQPSPVAQSVSPVDRSQATVAPNRNRLSGTEPTVKSPEMPTVAPVPKPKVPKVAPPALESTVRAVRPPKLPKVPSVAKTLVSGAAKL